MLLLFPIITTSSSKRYPCGYVACDFPCHMTYHMTFYASYGFLKLGLVMWLAVLSTSELVVTSLVETWLVFMCFGQLSCSFSLPWEQSVPNKDRSLTRMWSHIEKNHKNLNFQHLTRLRNKQLLKATKVLRLFFL